MPVQVMEPHATSIIVTDNGDEPGLDGMGTELPDRLRAVHDGAKSDGCLEFYYESLMRFTSWERAWGADATGINDKACLYRNDVRRFCNSDAECDRVLSKAIGDWRGLRPYEWQYVMLSRATKALTGYATGAGTGRDAFLRVMIRTMDGLENTNRVTTLTGGGDRASTILNLAKASTRTGDAQGPAMAAALLTTMPSSYYSSGIDEMLAMLTTSMAEDPTLRDGGRSVIGGRAIRRPLADIEELADTARRADKLAIGILTNPNLIRSISPDKDKNDDPLAEMISETITEHDTRLRRATGKWSGKHGSKPDARDRLEEDLKLERNRLNVLTALSRFADATTETPMPKEILIEEWKDIAANMPHD